MARNKFLTTIAGLLNHRSNRRKSQVNLGSEGSVHRQKSDGSKYLTHLYQGLVSFTKQLTGHHSSRRWRRFFQNKLGRSFLRLLEEVGQFVHRFSVKVFYRLWRNVLVGYRQRAQAGFVLPVTVLMTIVILLVVTSLMFRSYQRSVQVIGDFQTQEVQNAATPAVERAKAKLELMFSEDGIYQITSGLPSESLMEEILLSQDADSPYVFPDETWIQLDTDGDGSADTDAGWTFKTDANGDGDTDDDDDLTTAYTIVFRSTKAVNDTTLKTVDPKLEGTNAGNITFERFTEAEKPNYLVVSNGPIIPKSDEANDPSCQVTIDPDDPNRPEVKGWFSVSTASMMKDFQVYAVSVPNRVANGDAGNAAISTILYQQDRTFSGGNKWGAWFRNDIEINPGFAFTWNGAMHTEGSIFTRTEGNTFRYYLISGTDSCFYLPETNSRITARGHFVNSLLWGNSSSFTGTVEVDRYEAPEASITMSDALDSVDDAAIAGNNASGLALNPLSILMNNASVPTDPNIDFETIKDANWTTDNSDLADKRVYVVQESSPPPYVDDTYRADNIYGPKPGYGRPEKDANDEYTVVPDQPIGSELTNDELIRDVPPQLEPENYGLDGYWERRARGDGMRVIVGQRLELGNAYGWNSDLDADGNPDSDPLNPPDGTRDITNLERQRRAQRDNLAAVQATLVYHQDSDSNGYEPEAVVATTVHPGTVQTLTDSATFENIDINGSSKLAIDFFNGHGTNGWEFDPASASWDFSDPTSDANMSNALSNLANFAGDPQGAFPPTQDDDVHPYPYLRMWGDYSNLRRALDSTRQNGSLAEKTTIQTAAATLGMLAYNIDYLQSYDYVQNQDTGLGGGVEALGDALWKLQDGDQSNGEVISIVGTATDYELPPENYIAALKTNQSDLGIDDSVIQLARLVMTKEQIERDRTYGFRISPDNHAENQAVAGIDPFNATLVDNSSPIANADINIACNVTDDSGNSFFGLGSAPSASDAEQRFVGLSRLCSNQPKFPSLYYIFPTYEHGHAGGTNDGSSASITIDHTQPDGTDFSDTTATDIEESYITDTYISGINTGDDLYKAFTESNIKNIALQPKAIDFSDWTLPTDTGSGSNPVSTEWDYVLTKNGNSQTIKKVALKDSAFFNGREEMSVRNLNLDLDLLRMNASPGGADTWLPETGMIYGFREDAVREDAIARPRNTSYSNYEGSYLTTPGIMDANNNIDPPLYNVDSGGTQDDSATVGISPKPVDYYADPDRRPYGFRLKHGEDLRRNGDNDVLAGLTFVSDNPTYIQGNFNGHGTNNDIVELTGNADGDNFYSRTRQTNGFGDPDIDPWRPSEVLADAVTILSESFCDGSVEDAYRLSNRSNPNATQTDLVNRYGCTSGAQFTSYLSQNRPNSGSTEINWARENASLENETDPNNNTDTSPVLFSRNGVAMVYDDTAGTISEYSGNYHRFSDVLGNGSHGRKTPLVTADAWVNVVMVSGNVPSRNNQGNGGLHNFPRLLERWNAGGRTLKIRGSFIQLNFSNYATAPFERDAWEPRSIGNGSEQTTMQGANCSGGNPCSPVAGTRSWGRSNHVNILFYGAPNRDWGYDVGLQYLPSGPVSRRLVIPEDPRSEFYREPKANNLYICNLREQINFPCN